MLTLEAVERAQSRHLFTNIRASLLLDVTLAYYLLVVDCTSSQARCGKNELLVLRIGSDQD
jgi:hypothetical protein